MHLEGNYVKQRDTWLNGIKYILENEGENIDTEVEVDYEEKSFPNQTFSLSQYMPGSDLIEIMKKGTCFNSYNYVSNDSSDVIYYPIRLKYNSNDADQCGSFSWNILYQEVVFHNDVQEKTSYLSGQNITDIYVGQKHPIWNDLNGLKPREELCLSIISKNQVLHLGALTQQDADNWLAGLQHILNQEGKS